MRAFWPGERHERGDKRLLSENADNDCVYSIIPILGMAGVGKTTLAQHLFQNEIVRSEFDLMIWVSLSQQCGVVDATRKIIEGITQSACTLTEPDSLHHKVISDIKGKKFLLVLDDMWDENEQNWSTLRVPLQYGAKGSKVLVTTRSSKVSQIMCTKKYRLSCLSDDECWSVCRQRACHGHKLDLCAGLTDIGKKIAAKCKGSPLAAEAVGSLLSKSVDVKHWERVLENNFWFKDGVAEHVLPAIGVSYEFLPLYLKRCFAYCSLFPKGYLFEKSKLVQLWVAQGFIQDADAKCFDDLVDWCFFQHSPSHYHTEGMYVMHDLYHELAQHVSGCEYSRTEHYKVAKLDDKARHSSLVPNENHSQEVELDSLCGRDLRSFLFVGRTEFMADEIPFCLKPCDIFRHLECLRALDLCNTDIAELPDSIGNLIHLRYLSLENTRISCLPESLGCLFNILTVNFSSCDNLKELPRAMKLLDNLRHLYLSVTRNCNIWMPSGIGKLTNLQTLPLFVVGSGPDSCRIEELGDLEKLGEELCISGLNNISDAHLAGEAKMKSKPKLKKLTLEWSVPCCTTSADSDGEEASKVLEMFKPNPNLEELHIRGFPGTKFPLWLSSQTELKLVTLDLNDCINLDRLPSLGRLPYLKHLWIQSTTRLRRIGDEFYGFNACSSNSSYKSNVRFPVLETLVFKKMDAWEEWVRGENGDFPCLRLVTLNSCGKLRLLPQLSPSVHLRVKNCPLLNVSVSRPLLEYAQCISLA